MQMALAFFWGTGMEAGENIDVIKWEIFSSYQQNNYTLFKTRHPSETQQQIA